MKVKRRRVRPETRIAMSVDVSRRTLRLQLGRCWGVMDAGGLKHLITALQVNLDMIEDPPPKPTDSAK